MSVTLNVDYLNIGRYTYVICPVYDSSNISVTVTAYWLQVSLPRSFTA